MSKSLGKEFFDQYGIRWKKAAKAKGIEEAMLDKVWEDLCAYGSWAFNKSHAVAYGIVSYWCCWFKAHHPLEFAAATLDSESEPLRQIKLLRELSKEGTEYVSVDPGNSVDRWSITEKGNRKILVGPLTQIKGVGPATVSEILLSRAEGKELKPSLKKRLLAAKTEIDSIYPIADRVKKLFPDLSTINIISSPKNIIDVQCGVGGEVMIIGVLNKINPKDENEAVNVARRGYAVKGPIRALSLFILDDTDEIYCKIDRFNFERLGVSMIERGRAGKSIYAIKGTVPNFFRMILVKSYRYIGDMTEDQNETQEINRKRRS
jgi:hypothetical protein